MGKTAGEETETRGLDRRVRVARYGRMARDLKDARVVNKFEERFRDVRLGVASVVVMVVISLEATESEVREGKFLVKSTILKEISF